MEALLAFAAALLALRLGGRLAGRWRARRAPELAAWSAALFAYAVAAGALAWGAAHGWDARAYRVYYLAGGLLTAPLLGAGSLLIRRWRWPGPVALAYAGLAIGVAVAVPLHGTFAGGGIPTAHAHLDFVPARLVAVVANAAGTLAVVGIAATTFRRRPLGNTLIVAGVALAAIGTGLGTTATAAFALAAVVFLYAGFVARR
ncbi:MAG: hypothetical protein ACYDA3_02705 [Gaiellaceae bacterium]